MKHKRSLCTVIYVTPGDLPDELRVKRSTPGENLVYCQDKSGAVYRAPKEISEDPLRALGNARPGARSSAADRDDRDQVGNVSGEVLQVAGVACVDIIVAAACGLDHDSVDDVGGPGTSAQLARLAG
jgi:hypothetical protein